ncbi:hypothetical protein Lac3_23740 [Claveliimonas bilis]|nr:hypothetical protein Lac3_23740 [Claveliimonas bilis]
MAKVWEREDEYNEKYKKEKDKSTASKADEKILEERNDLPGCPSGRYDRDKSSETGMAWQRVHRVSK